MNKLILFFTLLFFNKFYSQKIYSVDYKSQSDIKVFVVDYESQADLNVFKVDYKSQAKGNEGFDSPRPSPGSMPAASRRFPGSPGAPGSFSDP